MLKFINKILGRGEENIYSLKSRLKIYLAIIGLLIVSASSMYTYFLVERLKEQEQKQMEIYRQASEVFGSTFDDLPENMKQLLTNMVLNDNNIPLIATDDHYNVIDVKNITGIGAEGIKTTADSILIKRKLDKLIANNIQPIYVRDELGMIASKFYYDDSNNLTLLKYYPFFQFTLIAFFIGFGYLTFSAARRSEQNQVWVGMAKETAHQLGTPIAAIMGWIEHLRSSHEGDGETQEVVNELENDVNRLTLVADRFSKIGSEPELKPVDIYEELNICRDYMQKRSPRKVKFEFPKSENTLEETPQYNAPKIVKINPHLFDWVIENLLRNALDAMDGEGVISANVYEDAKWVCMDITDTGKGIPKNKFQTVFQPGFTTKKRGWGLGLSLAKRIIEEYHSGKIFVKDSELGKFTTFTIKMPKN